MKGTTQQNVPSLRFPEFSGKWEIKKIGDVTEKINSGKTPLGGESVYLDRGILFIRSQNINNNMLCLENSKFISEELNNTMKNSIVKANDILLNITGASLGRSCVVPTNFEIGNVNQHVCIVRVKEDNNPNFIQIIFSSDFGQNTFSRLQTGSGREGLNFQNIKSLYISFPLFNEQKKIAHFFTTIDDRLQNLQKQKDLLEQYKKGMMQRLFSQSLRFKDEDGNDFEEWKEKSLSDFMIERNTQFPKTNKYPLMSFVANKGVTHKGDRYNREFLVNDEGNKKYKQTEYGDFIYSSNNLETGSIGLNNYGSASISPVYSIFKINELYDYRFISIYLCRKEFISKMTKFRQGVVYGQWKIHEKDFLQINEKLPCPTEQTKIANFLSEIDGKIANVQAQILALQQWKKGLMHRMFC